MCFSLHSYKRLQEVAFSLIDIILLWQLTNWTTWIKVSTDQRCMEEELRERINSGNSQWIHRGVDGDNSYKYTLHNYLAAVNYIWVGILKLYVWFKMYHCQCFTGSLWPLINSLNIFYLLLYTNYRTQVKEHSLLLIYIPPNLNLQKHV